MDETSPDNKNPWVSIKARNRNTMRVGKYYYLGDDSGGGGFGSSPTSWPRKMSWTKVETQVRCQRKRYDEMESRALDDEQHSIIMMPNFDNSSLSILDDVDRVILTLNHDEYCNMERKKDQEVDNMTEEAGCAGKEEEDLSYDRLRDQDQNPHEQVRWFNRSCNNYLFPSTSDKNDNDYSSSEQHKPPRFLKSTNFIQKRKSAPCPSISLCLLSLLILLLLLQDYTLFDRHRRQTSTLCSAYQLTNNLIASNLPPKFITSNSQQMGGSNSEIVVRVKEGPQSIGKLIYTLRGEDPDDDPITFGVLGSMASDLLRIENVPKNQANVYLKKELDRETTESYQVVITLTDGKLGRGNWITKSMLIIVEDVNDNYPIFGPHRTSISVREDSKWPMVIETLEATDQDEGRFGQVVYRLDNQTSDDLSSTSSSLNPKQSGAAGDVFAIETIDGKGVISLVGRLDFEFKSLYQLRVLAIDRATESERLTTSTSILITVEDCEDQSPMFTFVPSITRIPENLPIGSQVVRVTAIDGDRGVNNPIEYQIISINGHETGPERNLFSIDSRSGLIRVSHELDREWNLADYWSSTGSRHRVDDNDEKQSMLSAGSNQPASFLIQIKATEIQQSNVAYKQEVDNSVSTELTIILTDVNDEPPTFNKQVYYGEILENSPPESLVSFVLSHSGTAGSIAAQPANSDSQTATTAFAKVVDRDQGTNGTFTLHLEGESARLFEVWPREATNEANLMIKVASNSQANELVAGRQIDHLVGSNGLTWLDYEKNKQFKFNIIAREKYPSMSQSESILPSLQPFESVAQMVIFVKDTNDNYPQFQSDLYKVEVPENAIHGMHICTVKATDLDSGIYGTSGIRYTEIRGEKANKFNLDPISGTITLKTSHHGFDRENVAQYNLIVEARDANGLGNRNTTQLLIVITDVNDQKPKFLLDHYEAFIYENELEFQNPPLQVQAIDTDAPGSLNSRITYSIVAGDPQSNFTIDPQTGRIRVKSSLILSTSGPGSFNATNGANKYQHHHNQHHHHHQQHHNIPHHLTNEIEPSTTTQSSNNLTSIAQSSGLDFESIAQKRDETRQFNLTIKASDSGLPEPLSDYTQVVIVVYDKNDHAPVFTRSIYSKSLREDAREGSQVLQVLALDGDQSPTNSRITYRISSGGSDKFVIDSDSGLISVASGANLDIDRATGGGQKRTQYLLSVLALDGSFGSSQNTASCLVNITIIDINNKAPEFVISKSSNGPNLGASNHLGAGNGQYQQQTSQQQQQQIVHINEDAPYGLIVTRIQATDLDSNSELRYSINYARSEARNEDMMLVEPSQFKDAFSIDTLDGTIKVMRPLDRELFDQVKLRLQVEDIAAETPSEQIAYTNLIIRITDVNDNRPTFKQPVYKAVVNENSMVGTSIIILTADDRDLNKTLRYSLDGAPEMLRLIRINPRSGEITVNDKIDRELYPQINVTVRAEDSGQPHSLMGSAQLLINVRDENDNNPTFVASLNPHTRYSSTIGNRYSQSSVSSTPSSNHRSSASGSSNWVDTGSNGARFRSLSSSTGSDTMVGFDDTSAASLSTVIHDPLTASGSGNNLLSSNTGTNNNLPFLAPGSTAYIREDSPIGMQIAYVYAEDADVENNGRVTYMLDPISSGGKFRIDRDTGILSVAAALDRESVKSYSLIIEASDNYDLGYSTGESRRAFTQVNFHITDVNDNAPVISTNLLQPNKQSSIPISAPSSTDLSSESLSSSGPSTSLRSGRRAGSSILSNGLGMPSQEEIINSPGPYEIPMPDCLFINEFQPINEPILTITATDLDDPSLGNGQIDLAIISKTTSGQLFSLTTISPQPATGPITSIDEQPKLPDRSITIINEVPTDSPVSSSRDLIDGGAVAIATDATSGSPMGAIDNNNAGVDEILINSSTNISPSSSSNQTPMTNSRSHANPRRLNRSTRSTSAGNANPFASAVANQSFMNIYKSTPLREPNSNSVQTNPGRQGTSGKPEIGETQAYLVINQSMMEKVGNYSILVKATDRGQSPNGPMSSLKVINICVLDVNNHAPIFHRPPLNHTIRVMENATIGTHVTQVEATDADQGLNGEIQYSLKPTNMQTANNDWQAFKIDRLSGLITTAKLFNRQIKKYYMLRVQAQDFGKPTSLSSDIDVNIMIVNSGQYQPEFAQQNQAVNFTENLSPGLERATIISTNNLDDDPALINSSNDYRNNTPAGNGLISADSAVASAWPQSSPCYFIVDGDDYEHSFQLDRYTHQLTTEKMLDREKKANYTLLIQATNNCQQTIARNSYLSGSFGVSPSPSSTSTTISSLTTPIASARTKRSTTSMKRQLTMNPLQRQTVARPSGSSILAMQASEIKPTFASAPLQSPTPNYDQLLANDKSLLKLFIKVNDVNDNAPKFTQRIYTGGITTEADFGTIFMLVQAIDPDAEANGQVTYSIVKPIKRFIQSSHQQPMNGMNPQQQKQADQIKSGTQNNTKSRQRRSTSYEIQKVAVQTTTNSGVNFDDLHHQIGSQSTLSKSQLQSTAIINNSTIDYNSINSNLNEFDLIPNGDLDDLFVINAQTGEISLNFDPQKHMKGYFEFEVMANDTDGLSDSSMVFIYLLRQDQRVKFVLRLTPQELRQRLDKFRSVFGNITGAIVNIDSYKYFENLDGTVDKKKTSLFLHFVNPEDNTIIEVDKVLTLIDNNIEYLDELYKEFHVLSSEAAHLPLLGGSALIDPIDQVRTGLLGVASFLALILILVIAICVQQRTRYERQLKAASVSPFGGSPLHLDPDYHQQTNLPNTNLHSQDPNPIWMNGFALKQHNDWLSAPGCDSNGLIADQSNQLSPSGLRTHNNNSTTGNQNNNRCSTRNDGVGIVGIGIETDADYLSSHSESGRSSGLNSDLGPGSPGGQSGNHHLHHHHHHHHYNAATTATPRTDSLNSDGHLHCEAASSGSTNSGTGSASTTNDRKALCHNITNSNKANSNSKSSNNNGIVVMVSNGKTKFNKETGVKQKEALNDPDNCDSKQSILTKQQQQQRSQHSNQATATSHSTISQHSTFGAFKEVTIYTDHQQHHQPVTGSNLVRLVRATDNDSKASQNSPRFNSVANQINRQINNNQQPSTNIKIQAGPELSRVNKLASHFNAQHLATTKGQQQQHADRTFINNQISSNNSNHQHHQARIIVHENGMDINHQHQGTVVVTSPTTVDHENNLNKLSILNLETTEL